MSSPETKQASAGVDRYRFWNGLGNTGNEECSMKTSRGGWIGRMAAVVALLAWGGAGSAWAAPYTWNSTSGGNWNDGSATGWNTGGAYPNAQGDTATFSQNLGANPTITLNVGDARVGTLTLTDTVAGNGWTITNSAANPLTFDVAAGSATLNATGSSIANPHTISAPIAASVPLTLNLGANGGLVLSGNNASLTGGITVNGPGAQKAYVQFNSAASLGGVGNTITVSPGAQAVIAFSGLTQADLNRFAGSSGLLSFWESYHANGPGWGTPCSPAANLSLAGFNEYFRIGAGSINIWGDSTTISGTFTPPSNTFRFGGGGGRLTVDSVLADGAAARAVEISGTEAQIGYLTLVALTKPNTYTGPTEVRNGVLRLAGTSGTALNTSAFNVRYGAFLELDAGLKVGGWNNESGTVVGNNNNRIADTTAVNLYGGKLNFFGNPDTGTTETIGALNVNSGLAVLDARWKTGSVTYDVGATLEDRGGAGTGAAVLTAQSLNLNNGAQLWLRGVNVGVAGSSATRVMFTTTPTMVGGGGGAGSTTINILPGVFKTTGLTTSQNSGSQNWVTYDGTVGLREITSGASEYYSFGAGDVGTSTDNNALYQQTGVGTTLTVSSATTVNSMKFQFDVTSGTMTVGGTGPLTVKSGNVMVEGNPVNDGSTFNLNVPLDFNGRAGNIFWFADSFTSYALNSVMSNTGGNGVSFSVRDAGYFSGIPIGGNNTYTGPTTINAGLWLTSGSSERIPNASDLAVRAGAQLTIGNGLTETVASLSGAGTLALGNASSKLILGSGTGLAGAVTLEGASAYIAPGDLGTGTLTLSGLSATDGVRLRSGELRIDLASAQNYDVLSVGATKVTISDAGGGYAGSTLVPTLGYVPQAGELFKILDVAGATAIVGKFSNGDTLKATAGSSRYGFDILYNSSLGGGDGNDVVLRCTGKIPAVTIITIR
jgi:autotransporter-associated beta strand protein